ncbi:hypothetical protein KM043_000929 [Ampulex compressa]|nr:hypothetical protein KM043_000929 [Ampulex compressa]
MYLRHYDAHRTARLYDQRIVRLFIPPFPSSRLPPSASPSLIGHNCSAEREIDRAVDSGERWGGGGLAAEGEPMDDRPEEGESRLDSPTDRSAGRRSSRANV